MINFPALTLAIAEEIILGAGATTRQLNTVSLENNPEVTINTSGTTGVITASFDMGLGFVDAVAIDSDDSVVLYKPGLQRIKLVCSVAETDVLVTAQKGESTQALLEQKADLVNGLIPAEQLPSYVDDVIEVANYAALPVTGTAGIIYVTLDTSFTYRWTGSVYVQISGSEVTVASLYSSAGVVTIDLAAVTSVYTLTLTENVTSWIFNNLPASGKVREVEVQITQHASAAKTVISPASTGKTAGGEWTQSATVSAVEVLGIRVFSDGTKHLFPSGVFA